MLFETKGFFLRIYYSTRDCVRKNGLKGDQDGEKSDRIFFYYVYTSITPFSCRLPEREFFERFTVYSFEFRVTRIRNS